LQQPTTQSVHLLVEVTWTLAFDSVETGKIHSLSTKMPLSPADPLAQATPFFVLTSPVNPQKLPLTLRNGILKA
jgi:hypothetical protein